MEIKRRHVAPHQHSEGVPVPLRQRCTSSFSSSSKLSPLWFPPEPYSLPPRDTCYTPRQIAYSNVFWLFLSSRESRAGPPAKPGRFNTMHSASYDFGGAHVVPSRWVRSLRLPSSFSRYSPSWPSHSLFSDGSPTTAYISFRTRGVSRKATGWCSTRRARRGLFEFWRGRSRGRRGELARRDRNRRSDVILRGRCPVDRRFSRAPPSRLASLRDERPAEHLPGARIDDVCVRIFFPARLLRVFGSRDGSLRSLSRCRRGVPPAGGDAAGRLSQYAALVAFLARR